MKLNGIETVGVYLRTGGNAVRNQIYTYCISSCYDKTVHGKALGLDGNGKPIAYDFDRCQTYMNSLSTSARTNIMVSLYYSILKEMSVFILYQCFFVFSIIISFKNIYIIFLITFFFYSFLSTYILYRTIANFILTEMFKIVLISPILKSKSII